MKVVIKTANMKFFIILPTAILLNRFTATITSQLIKKLWPSYFLSVKDLMKLVNSVKQYRKNHKHLELINIVTANGEIIYINL